MNSFYILSIICMATHTDDSTTQKGGNGFRYSLFLFVGVCIASVGMIAWNYTQQLRQSGLETDLATLSADVEKLQNDDEIKLYTKLSANKAIIDKYKRLSKIDTFIQSLSLLSRTYDISLSGFSYSNGKLHVSALAKNDGMDFLTSNTGRYKLASQKIAKMIDGVRADKRQIFQLSFIESFVGQESISFSIELNLK